MKDRNAYLRRYRAAHKAEKRAYDQTRYVAKPRQPAEPREPRELRKPRQPTKPREPREPRNKQKLIIGIDGEGLSENGAHKYLYMAAWSTDRKIADLDLDPLYHPDPANLRIGEGRRTQACLEFLLSLPTSALILGYSLGYDYTKILEGLPDKTLYELARPECRQGHHGPTGRMWGDWNDGQRAGKYRLNYVKGRFSVSKIVTGLHNPKCEQPKCKGCKSIRRVTVWDIFAFFQGSFIKACKEWGVVTEAEYEALRAMKARRNSFTRAEWDEVKEYCGQECRKMAELGERLINAHLEAGLKLTSYYGAGSTASRMLKVKFRAKEFIAPPPPEMAIPVACGFFGGRFEISQAGPIARRVWSYDIASAYPYQFTFLPCLVCGVWELANGKGLQQRIERADIALVRYRLPVCDSLKVHTKSESSEVAWGPFPIRAFGLNTGQRGGDGPRSLLSERPSNGSILYPVSSGGGWVYRDEFLAGQRHFPNVAAGEAWVYTTRCSHSPFNDPTGERSTMPEEYKRRLEWGKEGKGIVVKLGTNSCYGKAAQSVGTTPPFQSFIWAGIVTSGCRAQLLDAMGTAKDPRSILMTATDGIVSSEQLTLAEPRDTDTRAAAHAVGKHPLGAWEEKTLDDGVMIIRPGIGFPLNSSIEAEVKARGIGKTVLANHRAQVLEQWKKQPGSRYLLSRTMFYGMKSATDKPSKGAPFCSRRANYGTWGEQPQEVNYTPFPKRPRQSLSGPLRTWAFGPNVVSAPYERLLPNDIREQLRLERKPMVGSSPEAQAMREEQTLALEQPEWEDEDNDFRRDEGDL